LLLRAFGRLSGAYPNSLTGRSKRFEKTFYGLGEFLADRYALELPSLRALESLSPDVRAEVEERAAILEFDGGMERTQATATALSLHRQGAKGGKH